MTRLSISFLVASSMVLPSCSSKPRNFTPALQAAPADQAAYDQTYERCRILVAQGQRSNFGAALASGAVGTVTGVGVAAAATAGTYGSYAAAAGAMAGALVLMPVVGVAAAWGLAKNRRLRKERDVKQATAQCLSESGYVVDGWERTKKNRRAKLKKTSRAGATVAPAQTAQGVETATPEPK